MSAELIFGLITLFGVAAIGVPVAYAIITGVVVYLGVSEQDLAIAGETMVQRLFDGRQINAEPSFLQRLQDPAQKLQDRQLHQ